MFSRRQRTSSPALAAAATQTKNNILEKLIETVKEIQNEYKSRDSALDLNELTGQLCSVLEAIFIHGLKETFLGKLSSRLGGGLGGEFSPKMPEPSFWTFSLVFSHKQVISTVERYSQISTEVGRCRAWLRLALNDGLFGSYLSAMSGDQVSLSVHYDSQAFLRDQEKMDLAIKYITGIEVFQFNLATNVSMLNRWLPEPLILAGLWSAPLSTALLVDTGAIDAATLAGDDDDDDDGGGMDDNDQDEAGVEAVTAAVAVDNHHQRKGSTAGSELSGQQQQSNRIRTLSQPVRSSSTSYYQLGLLNEDEALRLILQATPVSLPPDSPRGDSPPPEPVQIVHPGRGATVTGPPPHLLSPQRTRSPSPRSPGPPPTPPHPTGSRKVRDSSPPPELLSPMEEDDEEDSTMPSPRETEPDAAAVGEEVSIYNEITAAAAAAARLTSEPVEDRPTSPRSNASSISVGVPTPQSLEWDDTEEKRGEAGQKEAGVNLAAGDEPASSNAMEEEEEEDEEEMLASVSDEEHSQHTHKSSSMESDKSKESSCSCWCSTLGPRPGCRVCLERPVPSLQLAADYSPPAVATADLIAQETECRKRKSICKIGFQEKPTNIRVEAFSLQKNLELLACLDLIPHESGIDAQDWRCIDCTKAIGAIFGGGKVCAYTKKYYCDECHADDQVVIPARLAYNWDGKLYRVARSSLAFIRVARIPPIINLSTFNPKLGEFVPQLEETKRLRKKLSYLNSYISACSRASMSEIRAKLTELLVSREYFVTDMELYSLSDLEELHRGELNQTLARAVDLCTEHVDTCLICGGRGFICEVCKDKRPVYPFHLDSTSQCQTCCTVFHSQCSVGLTECPKCERLAARSLDNLVIQSKLARETME